MQADQDALGDALQEALIRGSAGSDATDTSHWQCYSASQTRDDGTFGSKRPGFSQWPFHS